MINLKKIFSTLVIPSFLLFIMIGFLNCKSTIEPAKSLCNVQLSDIPFTNEEYIHIEGYDEDAMEVDISADGQVLMFNDKKEDTVPRKELHWASRVTDTLFKYEGKVIELNTSNVDGTPSFDQNGVLYFTSTDNYAFNGFNSLYVASKDQNGIYQPELIEGLAFGDHYVSVDPDITNNSKYMFFSLFHTDENYRPDEVDIKGTVKNESGGFDLLDDSIFVNINTLEYQEYAPTISSDGLEMYFSRAHLATFDLLGIYRTSRSSTDLPFEPYTKVEGITGIVEAPSFNNDETAIYYHRETVDDRGFKIYRMTRSLPSECQ